MIPDLSTLPLTPTADCIPDPFAEQQRFCNNSGGYRYPYLLDEMAKNLPPPETRQDGSVVYRDWSGAVVRIDTPSRAAFGKKTITIYKGEQGNERKVLEKDTATCAYRYFEGEKGQERKVRTFFGDEATGWKVLHFTGPPGQELWDGAQNDNGKYTPSVKPDPSPPVTPEEMEYILKEMPQRTYDILPDYEKQGWIEWARDKKKAYEAHRAKRFL